MRIYLVRHGEAVAKTQDSLQPLSLAGRQDVARVAYFLSLFERAAPRFIYHSPRLRGKQNSGDVCRSLECSVLSC